MIMTKKKTTKKTVMLDKNNRDHIKLLYDNFFKVNQYIKQAIEKGEIETIENILGKKNALIKQIVSFEKVHQKEIKQDKELYSIKLHLIEKEKENIKLLEELKEKTTKEYSKASKMKKLYSAYEPSLNKTRSTFEINNEE